MSAKNFKIVSGVWYPRRNTPFRIVHGEKGISVDEDYALTGSEVPTHTCFKKVKPTPIRD